MEILEKVAYMKGLAEGPGPGHQVQGGQAPHRDDRHSGRYRSGAPDIREDQGELEEALDAVSDDLSDVEACLYESEDEDEDEEDDAG